MATSEVEAVPNEATLTADPTEDTAAQPGQSQDMVSSSQPADGGQNADTDTSYRPEASTQGTSVENTQIQDTTIAKAQPDAGGQTAGVAGGAGSTGDSVKLTAKTEHPCYSPSSKQECWAISSLQAPLYEPSSRASVDIVAVIDKSGSMRGEKIALVRKTLEFVIDQCKLQLYLRRYRSFIPGETLGRPREEVYTHAYNVMNLQLNAS